MVSWFLGTTVGRDMTPVGPQVNKNRKPKPMIVLCRTLNGGDGSAAWALLQWGRGRTTFGERAETRALLSEEQLIKDLGGGNAWPLLGRRGWVVGGASGREEKGPRPAALGPSLPVQAGRAIRHSKGSLERAFSGDTA